MSEPEFLIEHGEITARNQCGGCEFWYWLKVEPLDEIASICDAILAKAGEGAQA
jgi:hypothetical protein